MDPTVRGGGRITTVSEAVSVSEGKMMTGIGVLNPVQGRDLHLRTIGDKLQHVQKQPQHNHVRPETVDVAVMAKTNRKTTR